MKLSKCLTHAMSMVLHSKIRSWLTILGIVIGVAAVISIVSLGAGMEQAINSQLSGLGGDIITLSPGFSRGSRMFGPQDDHFGGGGQGGATTKEITLTKTDLQALRGIPDLLYINTQISGSGEASYLGKTGSVRLTGVDQGVWSKITTEKIAEGRMLDAADQNVIVVGGGLASDFFSQPLGINKMITIEGSAFRVVGILNDSSTGVYMPIQMAYQVIDDKTSGVYDSIVVKVRDEDNLDATLEKINTRLMAVRHVTDRTKDFTVTSSKQMQATRSEMMGSMQMFLTALAAVSLIVGAVGIANTMFTAVLEKTKEIGIMKAIGARNRDIMLIFLLNAALIGLVGGLMGIIVGTVLSSSVMPLLISGLPMGRGASSFVSMQSALMALGVSVFVGIIAGLVPAYQGSKLKPVDALRYE